MSPECRCFTIKVTSRVTTKFKRDDLMIRILIADDSPAIRDGMCSLLDPTGDFQVVGLAKDGLQALEKARELRPDLVIMDSQMPNMDGVEATRHIKQTLPGIGILFFSVFADCLEAGITAGADGYLMKDCEPEELFSELRRIAAITPDGGLRATSTQRLVA